MGKSLNLVLKTRAWGGGLAGYLPVPEEGSPGADAAPLGLQLLALLAECSQLSVFTQVQLQVRSQARQLLRAFTRVVVDHFSLFL